MALLTNTAAPPWDGGLSPLGLRAEYERQLMMASIISPLTLAKIPPPGRGYFSVEEMYAVPELARTSKTNTPRANKRLLLCLP